MNAQIEKVVQYAKAQVGYSEEPKGSNKNKFAAMIDKEYPDFYNGKKNPCAWCDIFVDACFLANFGEEEALRLLCQPKKSAGAGCKFSAGYYKAKKQFHSTPEVGDQIFFIVGGDINHTGIVTGVDDKKVYTIEGNSGDAVKAHSYSLDNKKIAGYGRPAWREDAVIEDKPVAEAPANAQKPALLSDEEVAREVIAGKWGNGKERETRLKDAGYNYSKVQALVNKIIGQKPVQQTQTFVGTVNTISLPLRVRKGAGTNYPVLALLPKGSKVRLITPAVNGWYKLADGNGYVSSQFIAR